MANVSPLLMKGAILVLEPNTGIPLNTIHLQYNPESIRRSLQPQSVETSRTGRRFCTPEGSADRDHSLRR